MALTAATQVIAADPSPVFLEFGPYRAVIGTCRASRDLALSLRASVFRNGVSDVDQFDALCLHGCVAKGTDAAKVAFRARLIASPETLADSYSGQHYDLSPLQRLQGPFLELGRFCQSEGPPDVTALRLAWAALGVLVDRHDIQMMMGCSSFSGADAKAHSAELAFLRANHVGPAALRPKRLSPKAIDLPTDFASSKGLPQLLRSYLGMGGWVSDHAVLDCDLNRLHLFTGLAIAAIPEPRKARLRALAQAAQTTPLDLAPAAP